MSIHNNSLHADSHKRHDFCEKEKSQKPRPLWHPVKLALAQHSIGFFVIKISLQMIVQLTILLTLFTIYRVI